MSLKIAEVISFDVMAGTGSAERGRKRSLSNGSVTNEVKDYYASDSCMKSQHNVENYVQKSGHSNSCTYDYPKKDSPECHKEAYIGQNNSKPIFMKCLDNEGSKHFYIPEKISSLFEKKFCFEKNEDFKLPPVKEWFVEKSWSVESLKKIKLKLNSVKECLNDMDLKWHEHTTKTNKAGDVIRKIRKIAHTELVTQAWCKFYEILCNYKIVPKCQSKFLSLHLCEAPGAFITALNYYLCYTRYQNQWDWLAGTLNPYYEGHSSQRAITDDRLIINTLKRWEFGTDTTGDIFDKTYIGVLKKRIGDERFSLVTADGSIDCFDNPGEQENMVAALQYTEVVVALKLLDKGGSLVVKKFTLYECISVCIMYFLTCVFREVHVFKPATSKAGNSEVYVICLGYIGANVTEVYLDALFEKQGPDSPKEAMFPQKSIPVSFLIQLEKCCTIFMNYQQSTIKENLELYYQGDFKSFERYLACVKEQVVEMYLERCHLNKELKIYKPLCGRENMNYGTWFTGRNYRELEYSLFKGSFNGKQAFQKMPWKERFMNILSKFKHYCSVDDDKKATILFSQFGNLDFSDLDANENWIITGKPFKMVKNSKFVDSWLIELWNEISSEAEVLKNESMVIKYCLAKDDIKMLTNVKILLSSTSANDPLKSEIYSLLLPNEVNVVSFTDYVKDMPGIKLLLFNLTDKKEFLLNEIMTKQQLLDHFITALEILQKGDSVVLCLHDVLMRVTVGVIYLVWSLFKKVHILPSKNDSLPVVGQVWIFVEYCEPTWTTKVLQLLKTAGKMEKEQKNVLELVPITKLCRGQFYKYMLQYNRIVLTKKIMQLLSEERRFLTTNNHKNFTI